MESRPSWSSVIVLAAEPASASRAREFVRRCLGEHRLSHLLDDVELVTSELVTNALVHARTSFRVSLQASDQTLRVDVADGSSTSPVRHAPELLATGGRGIGIVDLMSSSWGVVAGAEGGKTVWAEFDRSPAVAGSGDPLAAASGC